MKRVLILLLISTLFLPAQQGQASDFLRCLKRWGRYQQIKVSRSFGKWYKELKADGAKRLLIKKKKPTGWELSEKKFYGLLFSSKPEHKTKWYFEPITTIAQSPLTVSSKLITGKTWEFTPFKDEFYLTKLERLFLKKDKSFTAVPRLIILGAPSIPIYSYLYDEIEQRKKENLYEKLLKQDFAYVSLKSAYEKKQITREQALELVANRELAFDVYIKTMNELSKEGFHMDNIATTQELLGNEALTPFLQKLMPEIWDLSDPEIQNAYGLDTSEMKEMTLEVYHQVLQVHHRKFAQKIMLEDYFNHGKKDFYINDILEDNRYQLILNNANLSNEQKRYHMDEILHYQALLGQWEKAGIKFPLEDGQAETFDHWLEGYLTRFK